MMITLKAALVGTSCIGVLAVGGVTYATVAHPHAGLRSDRSNLPDAKPAAPVPSAPTAPQCLPKPGDVEHAVPQQPAVPQAGAVRQQAAGAPQAARQAVEQQGQQAAAAKQAPATVPHSVPAPSQPAGRPAPGATCLPSGLPKGVEPGHHPAKPHAPGLPPVQRINCDTIKPAVVLGGPAEKSIILSRGLGHGTKHVEIITHKAHKLCKVTEKWMGAAAGQWLKVERIKTPQPYSIDELRQALRLPAGGAPTSVEGMRGWQTPLGGAVLWYSESGFVLCVEGSPAYAPQLQDVASKLQQQAQEVR